MAKFVTSRIITYSYVDNISESILEIGNLFLNYCGADFILRLCFYFILYYYADSAGYQNTAFVCTYHQQIPSYAVAHNLSRRPPSRSALMIWIPCL